MLLKPSDYTATPCNFQHIPQESFQCKTCTDSIDTIPSCPPILNLIFKEQNTVATEKSHYQSCDMFHTTSPTAKKPTQRGSKQQLTHEEIQNDDDDEFREHQIPVPDTFDLGPVLGHYSLSKQEKSRYRHNRILTQFLEDANPSTIGIYCFYYPALSWFIQYKNYFPKKHSLLSNFSDEFENNLPLERIEILNTILGHSWHEKAAAQFNTFSLKKLRYQNTLSWAEKLYDRLTKYYPNQKKRAALL